MSHKRRSTSKSRTKKSNNHDKVRQRRGEKSSENRSSRSLLSVLTAKMPTQPMRHMSLLGLPPKFFQDNDDSTTVFSDQRSAGVHAKRRGVFKYQTHSRQQVFSPNSIDKLNSLQRHDEEYFQAEAMESKRIQHPRGYETLSTSPPSGPRDIPAGRGTSHHIASGSRHPNLSVGQLSTYKSTSNSNSNLVSCSLSSSPSSMRGRTQRTSTHTSTITGRRHPPRQTRISSFSSSSRHFIHNDMHRATIREYSVPQSIDGSYERSVETYGSPRRKRELSMLVQTLPSPLPSQLPAPPPASLFYPPRVLSNTTTMINRSEEPKSPNNMKGFIPYTPPSLLPSPATGQRSAFHTVTSKPVRGSPSPLSSSSSSPSPSPSPSFRPLYLSQRGRSIASEPLMMPTVEIIRRLLSTTHTPLALTACLDGVRDDSSTDSVSNVHLFSAVEMDKTPICPSQHHMQPLSHDHQPYQVHINSDYNMAKSHTNQAPTSSDGVYSTIISYYDEVLPFKHVNPDINDSHIYQMVHHENGQTLWTTASSAALVKMPPVGKSIHRSHGFKDMASYSAMDMPQTGVYSAIPPMISTHATMW